MSLTYLQNNSFNYQDIPANAIVYRSGTSGFETIQQSKGVLMSDGSTYSFGIPTAAELVGNYTSNNSLIMTENNKLVEVPVEGSSTNKLLRYINNTWKIVDFSVEYIKPELYDPSSWQLWIADSDINVINIPKDNISANYYGVKYNELTNQFNVIPPDLYTQARTRDYYINYKDGSSYDILLSSFPIHIYYHMDIDLNYSICIFSSNLKCIGFDYDRNINNPDNTNYGSIYLNATNNVFSPEILSNISGVVVFGGLYVKKITENCNKTECICTVTDGISSFQTTNPEIFKYINKLYKVNDSGIIPVKIYAYNTEKVKFTRTPDIYLYIKIYMDDDGSVIDDIRWCSNPNFVNVLVTSGN